MIDERTARFETLLSDLCARLNSFYRVSDERPSADDFERLVRTVAAELVQTYGFYIDDNPHPYAFPDIGIEEFGIEVKYSRSDSWRSVANSIFESHRDPNVTEVFVVFGKFGGRREVRYRRYGDSVIHVRTSHVPRFEVDLSTDSSLFHKFGIDYSEFVKLGQHEKMVFVREYARGRLKPGERLWWLDEDPEGQHPESTHTLEVAPRLYTSLDNGVKRRLRAEAALLCPQVMSSRRKKGKYDDATMYLLTYHGVLCNQARDLFSAGSVAMNSDSVRGGIYIERAMLDIMDELRTAAHELPDSLFLEYWGQIPSHGERIARWLEKADLFADRWQPSATLAELLYEK